VDDPLAHTGCSVRARAFDFETKSEREIGVGEIDAAMCGGSFVWIDVDFSEPNGTRALLGALSLIDAAIVEDALTREAATQVARYEDYLRFVVSGCELTEANFALQRVDYAIGERFLLTIHKGHWRYGYALFWLAAIAIVGAIAWLSRRARLL
jgi:Mg2+ and Co2+ transporter CorA